LDTIAQIINGCIAHDHKYQKIVYDKYRGFALKLVFRYIYRYEKALDVMNDGFVKLFNHFPLFKCQAGEDPEKLLMGLIRRIMINSSIDELRRTKMLPEIGGIPDHVWEIPDNSQNPEQLMLFKELILLIKKLPPQYRTVFNMYVIDGFSHYEIANALDISTGTSKSSLSRARTLLKKFIAEEEKEIVCNL
jgi:RNA polymerase sigma factor (sigma-70 family)